MGVPPLPQDHESQCCLALSDCGSYSEEFVCATDRAEKQLRMSSIRAGKP